MSEITDDKKIFSLREVALSIQKTLELRYTSTFWVKAEMNKLNYYPHFGHCYPELVEKNDGKTVATMKAGLWKNDYLRINKRFIEILKEPLKDGIKILFRASIEFHTVHGLSLRIIDIDPSFSLGELEREKQETIERLRKEEIFDLNRNLKFPLLAQRIAVISVQTSKGLSDYLKILNQNEWNYKYFNMLFPAVLQGDNAITSIIYQLSIIKRVAKHFDAVAIIRGGGGDLGLSAFNNFELAKAIATFPIPVLTGIGHSTNETAAEMVAHKNAITPTELADFLLQVFHDFSVPVQDAGELLKSFATDLIANEGKRFDSQVKYFHMATRNLVERNHNLLERSSNTVVHLSRQKVTRAKDQVTNFVNGIKKASHVFISQQQIAVSELKTSLQGNVRTTCRDNGLMISQLEHTVEILDPVNVLKRGYSITTINGKAVTSVDQVTTGDRIITRLADGEIVSNVNTTTKMTSDGK